MIVKRIKRRWKVLAIGILALACIGISFNIWFIQNTNSIIESLVSDRSNGHIHLQLKKSTFQYFKKKIVLYGASFSSEDTTGARTNYQFDVPKLDLKIRSFWSFLLYRELLIDSIALKAPEVTVTRLSKAVKQDNASISIPEEIGRIYNSILDALQVLQVKRFQIDDGKFNLVNKIDPRLPTTTISNIHFHIINFKITADSTTSEKFLNSDNVVLHVKDQNIMFPDGIHHMSFKDLQINVGSRQVELDSCWLHAETKKDRNSFRIFFDVLKMTNLDFTALYRNNLIKADSVYITNPDIELALEIKRKKEKNKKLELDTIIQQFTGDLALGYIGVQNATVNIVANRSDTTTTFSTKNDNFEMFGLRVNSDSSQPVYVDEFAMILRKYETYSRDSSALYRFDSLRFTNNKVRLSNFTIRSIEKNDNKGSLYYSIPVFELTGLSWEDLLFDRYIKAEKAVLLNPEIAYSIGTGPKKSKGASLFKILSGLNEAIDLNSIEIRNGNLNIQLPAGKRLSLQQVDLVLASNKLLASTSYTGMQQAIDQLAFSRAFFTTGNLRAELINLRYSDRLHADELRLANTDKTLVALAKGITLNDLVWNNTAQSVFVDHLAWQQASVVLKTGAREKMSKATNAIIELNQLTGYNTLLTLYAKDKLLKTKVDKLTLDDLEKKQNAALRLKGFAAEGKFIAFNTGTFALTTGPYHISDNGISDIRAISFLQASSKDTIRFSIPQTFFKPHIEALLKGTIHFDKITAKAPVFNLSTNTLVSTVQLPVRKQYSPLPYFSIDEIALQNPVLHYLKQDSAITTIDWLDDGKEGSNNSVTFYKVHSTPIENILAAGKIQLGGYKALYTRNSKVFGIDSGLVRITFNDVNVHTGETLNWNAFMQEALFQNPISLALKKQGGIGIGSARLRSIQLSADNSKNIYRLLQENPAMQLQIANGSYTTEKDQLHWKDLLYSQSNRSLLIDSFAYQPALSRDSFIARSPKQIDYMHAVLKNIRISDIDLTALEQDSIFTARSVVAEGSDLNIYRDKRKPYIAGKLRPLPVFLLQQIPAKVAVDTLALKNANVTYTEMSDKTGQEGQVSINRINARLYPLLNYNINPADSLVLDAEGYLMDSAWMRLRVKESYTDSLGTFIMALRMKPADFSILNPALIPLASVKINAGHLDTLDMRAVGNDYFSIGEMQLYYKDLKIQFLKRGSETKKTLLTGLVTLAANNFIIRKHNDHRTGMVYFLRSRNRSFFNFLVKSALSGIASSVGAKRNKKYYRQYKRQQKLYKLPAGAFG